MIQGPVRLWLCCKPTDMRKSFDVLSALVKRALGSDPLCGHGFVFINRRRTQLKCLYFDQGGYCIWAKRLEAGQFARLAPEGDGRSRQLSQTEFASLVEGLDLVIKKRRKRWSGGLS